MGNSNYRNTMILDNLYWNMTKSDKTNIGTYFNKNIKNIHIICPIKKDEDEIIKIKLDEYNFLNLLQLFQEIHNVYKGKKIDKVFFEGFDFVKKTTDTVTYIIITGS